MRESHKHFTYNLIIYAPFEMEIFSLREKYLNTFDLSSKGDYSIWESLIDRQFAHRFWVPNSLDGIFFRTFLLYQTHNQFRCWILEKALSALFYENKANLKFDEINEPDVILIVTWQALGRLMIAATQVADTKFIFHASVASIKNTWTLNLV